MDETVAISAPPQEAPDERVAIAMPYSTAPIVVDDPTASKRAMKTSIGVPELPQSLDEIKEKIKGGQEQSLREEAVARIEYKKRSQQIEVINKMAGQEKRPLTLVEAEYIKSIVSQKQQDPNSVVEEGYAEKFVENLRKTAAAQPDSWLNEAFKQIPGQVDKGMEIAKDLRSKKEVAQTLLEKAESALHQQSYAGYGVDLVKQLLPGYNEAKLRGYSDQTSYLRGLLGTNLDRQASDFYFLPFEQFKTKSAAVVDKLISDNPMLAVTFAKALIGQTEDEKTLNNIFSVFDTAGILQSVKTVKGMAEGARLTRQMSTAAKQLVKETTETASRAGIDEATGNLPAAGIARASEEFITSLRANAQPTSVAIERLQSAFNPTIEAIQKNERGLSQELVNRLVDDYTRSRDSFVKAVIESMKVERLPAVFAVQANVAKILKQEEKNYPGLANTILDTKIHKDELGVYYVDFYLGKSDANLFSTDRIANNFVKTHFLDKQAVVVEAEGPFTEVKRFGKIVQKGAGHYVVMSKPLDETSYVVRDALLATGETKTPSSLLNALGGWLGSVRTPEETLSLAQNVNRKVATFGPSNFFQVVKESSEAIKDLKSWALPGTAKRERWNQWKRVMTEAHKEGKYDPIQGTKDGDISFRSPGELSDLYQKIWHRAPDEQEIAASFSYKRKLEMLDSFNRLNEFRQKSRLGAQTHVISVTDESKEVKPGIGKGIPSQGAYEKPSFTVDGWVRQEVPTKEDTILILGTKIGDEWLGSTAGMTNSKRGKTIQDWINSGTKTLIELANPSERPFQNFGKEVGDARVRFVLVDRETNGLSSSALEWNRMRGLHPADVDYDHYVSQAIIRHDRKSGFHWYEGDTHIAAFNIRNMGKDVAERLNEIRKFIAADNIAGAQQYHATSGLPMEFSKIAGWFDAGVDASGKAVRPFLNKSEPIRLIPYNKTVHAMDKELENVRYKGTFKNGTSEGYGSFFDNRPDPNKLFSLDNTGTRSNPLYNVVPVQYLDPVTAINRALVRASNDAFLNDYKIFSVEHWIQEAKPFLNATDKELAEAPYHWFHNPVWKSVTGDEYKAVDALKTSQFQIKQFLGVQDQTTTFVHEVTQRLYDSIYNKFGSAKPLVPDFLLPTLRDPFEFLRKATFHAKLGLFAVPQLLVQMGTFASIWGIAGAQHAAPGTKAAFLHMLSRVNRNPEILDKMDELATGVLFKNSSNWKRGEWLEAYNLLIKSGFQNVAGEHVLRDNLLSHNIFAGKFEGFLDAGSFFFREGERQSRTGAWYTAYREFRDANPIGRITEAQSREILQRADLLSTNMSRASASTLHKGVFSIPTQFLSYQLRLTEQFLGKRLTVAEKARLFGTYAALYGVPSGFGLTGLPIGDVIRQKGFENGYNVGENWATSLIMEGLPSTLTALATGNWYNVGEKFAPQGLEPLRESFRSDKGFWDIVGGASFSTFAGALGNTDGFVNAMLSGIRDDAKHYPLKFEDFLDPFKEISSVNYAYRLNMALNTGKWLSKKEGYLSDASKSNAIFMTLSGLSPVSTSDIVPKTLTMKEEKEMQKLGLDRFVRELRRGFRAMEGNNPTQADDYFKRAYAFLRITGYPEENMGAAVAIAVKDYESIVDKINWEYYTKNVPESRKNTATQALEQLMKMKYR